MFYIGYRKLKKGNDEEVVENKCRYFLTGDQGSLT